MKVYIMRHGKTVWNEKGIIQGRSQNRLSTIGKSGAEEQSINFKDTHFDIIIASPLMRTMQTANIMNKYHNCKVLKDERIIEICQGEFTGRYKSTLNESELEKLKNRDESAGLESFDELYDRISDFIKYLKENYYDKSILVLSHGAPSRMLYFQLNSAENSNDDFSSIEGFYNAEIRLCEV